MPFSASGHLEAELVALVAEVLRFAVHVVAVRAIKTIPLNYVVDTQGEFRWWLEPQAIYDGINYDIADRGYAMGFFPTKSGTYTFVQGQRWIEMNLAGRIVAKHPLPPGYIDLSHASWEMPNGNILLRAAKYRYHRPDGQIVQSVRDFIIEVDRSGNVIDEWDLNTILDPTRSSRTSTSAPSA